MFADDTGLENKHLCSQSFWQWEVLPRDFPDDHILVSVTGRDPWLRAAALRQQLPPQGWEAGRQRSPDHSPSCLQLVSGLARQTGATFGAWLCPVGNNGITVLCFDSENH